MELITLLKWAIWLGPIGFVGWQAFKFATAKNISIKQGEVAIIENTLSGELRVLERGLHPINQFYERVVRESVSIKNEPSDPKPVEVKTKNLTGVKVDLVIIKNQIVDPLKATAKVDYNRLGDIVKERINVLVQKTFGKADLEDIFEAEATDDDATGNGTPKKGNKINGARVEELLNDATNEINSELARIADVEWGMEVEVAIQNFFLPPQLEKVAEDITAEDAEMRKIQKRANAYGVQPEALLQLDAQTQIGGLIMKALGGALGGGKK